MRYHEKLIAPGRLAFLIIFVFAILTLYIAKLYKLQIIEGNAYYEASINSITSHETIIAARGNILDRYGRLLVSNRNCNNLLINNDELFEQADPNTIILKMCAIITKNGDSYNDELPITTTAPFEFTSNISELQQTQLNAWLDANGLPSDATATEILAKMRTRYDIDGNYTAEDLRIIAGVRYGINIRYVINTSDYTFAEDVSISTITELMEADLPGFDVQVSYIREYNTIHAAHILGYTGLMTAEEYEIYQELGYPLNATVGKSGAEYAFEPLLHGTNGVSEITRNIDGIVTSTVYSTPPKPGNNIYLTIDTELQAMAESTLTEYIEGTNEQREATNEQLVTQQKYNEVEELITGGSIVALDVNTGEPLCIANYPTYDLTTFLEDYEKLLEDDRLPLVDRALTGMYSPGSTFKPCVALAALNERIIGADSQITCAHIIDKYADAGYAPRCTGTHGAITVTQALTYSCNVFFFELGDKMGINTIDKYASLLGLGQPTGIELPESSGRMASPETKAALFPGTRDASWYAADTLMTAIGQSITGVTPLQLARYTAAVANCGNVYSSSILKSASSYDYSESAYERKAELTSKVDAPDYVWSLIHEGMRGAVTEGTARQEFYGFPYTVAAKTGTTETGSTSDDAFFICYAPYEDPEIAVVVALENGAHGASLGGMAREILEYYFNFKESTQQTEIELTLLY